MHDLKAIFDPDHGYAAPSKGIGPVAITSEHLARAALGPDDLPGDLRVEFEERAAIMEYEGGLPRERAEAEALAHILAAVAREGVPLRSGRKITESP
jgi:hypothetical protein